MKKKNPFKAASLKETGTSLILGGLGNSVVDFGLEYAQSQFPQFTDMWQNIAKVALGVTVGGMTNGAIAKAANGVAVVGASNLINSLVEDIMPKEESTTTTSTTNGLPIDTIGRPYAGNRAYRKVNRRTVSGINDVMGE